MNIDKAEVSFPSLNATNVGAVQTAIESQLFLRQAKCEPFGSDTITKAY